MIDNGKLDEATTLALRSIDRLAALMRSRQPCSDWLYSPGSSFVLGTAIPVDGGYSIQG
jgi:hypothetical protein